MNTLTKLSAHEMRQGLVSKDFSSVELVQAHLENISNTNPELGSFISVCSDEAKTQAKKCDEIIAKEGNKSPALTGIPVAIKDMIVTKDIRTTCGSKILDNFIPPYDATVIQKLKESGSVLIGKTNQDEFAMGSSNENSAYGPVKNPWNTSRVAGGSSGGSAASVASFQSPLSLGTDTGGSIRQPASFNGVLGIKPTYGRVSRYGVVAYASSCDQVGPFARTVKDLSLILEAISGHDENDSTSMKVDVPQFSKELSSLKDLKGKRIGVPSSFLNNGIQKEVRKAFDNSIQSFKKLGAEIIEVELDSFEYALAAYYVIVCAEASSNLSRFDGIRYGHRSTQANSLKELYKKSRSEGFGKEVKRRIMMGSYALSSGYYDAYYRKAQQVRTLIIEDFKKTFEKCDFLATPTAPSTAFALGEKTESPLEMYLADVFTVPANLAGLPGISIPVGFDEKKLPIGLQLLAPVWKELDLLQAAELLLQEQEFDNSQIPV